MTTSEDGCPCRSAVARWCARCRKPPFQQHKHNASVSAKRTKCARLLFAIKNIHSPASSQFWATGSDIHRHRRCARRLRQLPTFLKQVPRWELQPPARWGDTAKVVLASNSPVGSRVLWLGFSEVQNRRRLLHRPRSSAPPPQDAMAAATRAGTSRASVTAAAPVAAPRRAPRAAPRAPAAGTSGAARSRSSGCCCPLQRGAGRRVHSGVGIRALPTPRHGHI